MIRKLFRYYCILLLLSGLQIGSLAQDNRLSGNVTNSGSGFTPDYTQLLGNQQVSFSGESDSAPIIADPVPEVFIPEAFTPNNDGINDELEVFGIDYSNLRLYIYSSNSELVYTMLPGSPPWDGTGNGFPMPAGTYFWKADFTSTNSNFQYRKEGKLILIR